jgi:hypothetical protein
MLNTKNLIYNRNPTEEDANEFGLVQYYRHDFKVWYFGYWNDRTANRDPWTHCGQIKNKVEPRWPTDAELDELFTEVDQSGECESWRPFARAVLKRWGS